MVLISAYECIDIGLQHSQEFHDTPCDSVHPHNVVLEEYAVSDASGRRQVVDRLVPSIERESAASSIRPKNMNGSWMCTVDSRRFASLGGGSNAASWVDEVPYVHVW